MPDVILFQEKV